MSDNDRPDYDTRQLLKRLVVATEKAAKALEDIGVSLNVLDITVKKFENPFGNSFFRVSDGSVPDPHDHTDEI